MQRSQDGVLFLVLALECRLYSIKAVVLNMLSYATIQAHLMTLACPAQAVRTRSFFKTGKGEYAEHDVFIGISVPRLRQYAKSLKLLPLTTLQELIVSAINEERLLALIVLIDQYRAASEKTRENIYLFYMQHREQVNNWNLVDVSAAAIVGEYLWEKDKNILLELAHSPVMWDRRIAMVSTHAFIRKQNFEWTLRLATIFLQDSHDLMHKATGWSLREVGKQNEAALKAFLNRYKVRMPRTALRYAIERFPEKVRRDYLYTV